MKKPIIAVDIDDTLAEHAEAFIAWSNETYGTNLSVEDYQDYWALMWQIDEEEAEERAKLFHATGAHGRLKPKAESKDVLLRLKERYELVIVSARRQVVLDSSREWLTKEFPDTFGDVRFVPIWDKDRNLTKVAICQEIGAKYLIDDQLKHCLLAAEGGLETVLFGDYEWNRQDDLPAGITRAKDWQEVERYFHGR